MSKVQARSTPARDSSKVSMPLRHSLVAQIMPAYLLIPLTICLTALVLIADAMTEASPATIGWLHD